MTTADVSRREPPATALRDEARAVGGASGATTVAAALRRSRRVVCVPILEPWSNLP
jgi:hypothetical protein